MARKRNKLTPSTRMKIEQIVRMSAIDKAPKEIASLMGMAEATVVDLMGTEEYRVLAKEYTGHIYANYDQMVEKRNAGFLMEEAAPDAAEALLALLHDVDPVQRRLSATAVLDRSGHGPVQRRAVRVRHDLDPVSAALLADAMRGANIVDVEAIEAEIVSDKDVKERERQDTA